MTENHPLTPPPELVQQWVAEANEYIEQEEYAFANRAAQWGADQELEACCEWLEPNYSGIEYLRSARRPKPPSLKEQALEIVRGTPEQAQKRIWRDMASAALVTGLIIGLWALVFCYYGEKSVFSNSLVTFAGGVLAVSGLLFRQYMLKEVLEYHNAWTKITELLTNIEEGIKQGGRENQASARKLVAQNKSAKGYCKYLQAELVLIPIVPVAVIFIYGCAIIASRSLQFRLGCLSLMLYLVVYLLAAAVSSSKLACSASEPNQIIRELEEIQAMLSQNK